MEDRWTMQESSGMLPALPGYNPVLDVELPEGWTAEYYGDDILYVGFEGEMAFEIWDTPDLHVVTGGLPNDEVANFLLSEIERIEGRYPIETYAEEHSRGV